MDTQALEICIEDVPSAPVGRPHIYDITASSASVSWCNPPATENGGNGVVYYVVEAKTRHQKTWDVVVPQCKELSCHIHNLKPGTAYRFRVRAANKHGLGAPSDSSESVVTADPFRSPISDTSDVSQSDTALLDELPFEPKDVKINTKDQFEDLYEVIKEVGKGKFGVVYKCKEKGKDQTWAAKIVKCREKEKANLRQEIEVMNLLRHPKLLMLWDAFESPRRMVLVMEYVGAGELFERVIGDDFVLTERDCVHFLRQICEGVAYMHTHNVLHLDLKPENILCVHENSNRIKIIDFGLARPFKKGDSLKVMFGTPEFIAPEVINYDEIDFGTDMWSVGVICYVLLSGLSPFLGDNDSETLSNVTSGEFDYDDEAFDEISDQAKDFISSLIIKRKEKRLLTEHCLSHDWLNQDEVDGMRYKRLNTDRLRRFMVRRKWLKTGNAVLAVSRLMKNSVGSFGRSVSRDSVGDGPNTPRTPASPDVPIADPFLELANNIGGLDMTPDVENNKDKALIRSEPVKTVQETEKVLKNGDISENDDRSSKPCAINSVDQNSNPKQINQNDSEMDQSNVAPTISKPMKDCEGFTGDVVRFDVTVAGSPSPSVEWYFEEQVVKQDLKHSFESSKGTHSLIIRALSESDEGEYSCKVTNSCGEDMCSAELSVLEL